MAFAVSEFYVVLYCQKSKLNAFKVLYVQDIKKLGQNLLIINSFRNFCRRETSLDCLIVRNVVSKFSLMLQYKFPKHFGRSSLLPDIFV